MWEYVDMAGQSTLFKGPVFETNHPSSTGGAKHFITEALVYYLPWDGCFAPTPLFMCDLTLIWSPDHLKFLTVRPAVFVGPIAYFNLTYFAA